jgi:hypothetical protein
MLGYVSINVRILQPDLSDNTRLAGNFEGRGMYPLMTAPGTPAGAGKPAAIGKNETATMTKWGIDDQSFGRLKAFCHMFQMADDLFFRNPDRLGKVACRHGFPFEFGHHPLS